MTLDGRIAALMREGVLEHFLRCDGSAAAFVALLTGPEAKQHATTLIGALMLADTMVPQMSGAESQQAISDINALCRGLAKLHFNLDANDKFDA